MTIFQYAFMQRALIVVILLGIITPLIGITVVLKRMSMIGDALSHSSLAGIALGLILGVNPVIGAIAVCIMAALLIEEIRKHIPRYQEMAIAIIMSAGIGLAGVLSGFVKNAASFNSFLFGSIVSISRADLIILMIVSVLVLFTALILYKELFYIGFDENAARISGVPVKAVNFIFTVLTALTVSISSRTAGALIVSSMLVVPVAFGMQLMKSYKGVIFAAIIMAVSSSVLGLYISFETGLRPGGTMVLIQVFAFLFLVIIKALTGKEN